MPVEAIQREEISKLGSPRNMTMVFSGQLDAGETLTGTPVTYEHGTSDLSFSSHQVSSTALTINGVSVPAGEAVQFSVNASNGVIGTPYVIDVVCGTSAGQTVAGTAVITCLR